MTNDNLFIDILPMTTLSIVLATSRASLVSSDNFPSQVSSMIRKIITKKDQRKNAQNSNIKCVILTLSIYHLMLVYSFIAILCILPLIFFCDNFSYHATRLRWKIIARN